MFYIFRNSSLAIAGSVILLVACGEGESTNDFRNTSGFSVLNTLPSSNSDDVAINSKIQVTFSSDVDQTSLNSYTFQVMETEGMSLIEGRINYNAVTRTATFEPYMPLTYGSPLHVMVTDKVRSASGTHLSSPVNVMLTTQDSPAESSFSPTNGAEGVNPRSAIRIQFGEGFNSDTISEATIKLETQQGQSVPFDYEIDEDALTVIVKPINDLFPNTQYRYTVTTGAKNTSGLALFSADQIKTFTTGSNSPFPTTIATNWDEYADSIKITTDGTLIVAGETWGSFNSDLVEHYDGDGFIAAINPTSGEVVDSIQFGSGNPTNFNLEIADPVYDMVTIGNDIFVTGFTTGNLSQNDSQAGSRKMYLAKYTWNGSTIQSSGAPVIVSAGNGELEGYAIAKNSTNNAIYVIGTTTGAIPGGVNNGGDDVVVAKFDTNLSQQWIKQYGTAARDIAKGIAVDGSSVYITGDTLGDFNNPANAHVGLNSFLLQLKESDGSKGGVTFDTTSSAANPGNAFARMATGLVAGGGQIYLVGTQQNSNGTSTYGLTYTAASGTPTYAVDGDLTINEDEQATGIYLSPAGQVYVAITRYHEMPVNGVMQLHGMTNIKTLSSSGFSSFKSLDADMHATVRGMVADSAGSLYATGYVHGAIGGMMPQGMGDVFVARP